MKRFFTTAVAALALGGTVLAAVPAEARPGGFGGGGHGYHGAGHGFGGSGYGRGGHYGGGFRGYRSGYGGYYGRGYYGDGAGVAIGAGILGLAVGSALAADSAYGDDEGYYADGYDDAPYGYPAAPYAYPGYGS